MRSLPVVCWWARVPWCWPRVALPAEIPGPGGREGKPQGTPSSDYPRGMGTGPELFPRRCSEQFIRNQEREPHIISKSFAICFFQKRESICYFLKGKEAASQELWLAAATAVCWAPYRALLGLP